MSYDYTLTVVLHDLERVPVEALDAVEASLADEQSREARHCREIIAGIRAAAALPRPASCPVAVATYGIPRVEDPLPAYPRLIVDVVMGRLAPVWACIRTCGGPEAWVSGIVRDGETGRVELVAVRDDGLYAMQYSLLQEPSQPPPLYRSVVLDDGRIVEVD